MNTIILAISVSAVTAFLVSTLIIYSFHSFLMKWMDDFFDEEKKLIEKYVRDIKASISKKL